MQADTTQNYFELFGIPVGFEVSAGDLRDRYRELQRAMHPDKFASASERERRLSVQLTANINEAFQTLLDPLKRTHYLLELNGIEINTQETTKDTEFLMEQMELRESLEEARHSDDPQAAVMELMQDVESRLRDMTVKLNTLFTDINETSLQAAANLYRMMQFIDKLRREAEDLEDELAMAVDD